ncbi:hypothetical protein [Aliikangiella coralliicola]|uniref:Uncharacterized protein n=1 Tax=Aliikangiella coralliicola TaxID=2592383 RepID=A0A545UFI1_9GAMM|nr:hypothetical protein [Aliikangiella coralliicola]TQV88230.1 hypothetical protein FLL46_06805 [Aliikangiella coralliicola]
MISTPAGVMNEWTVTYYNDQDSGILGPVSHRQWATQRLCFYYAGVADSHQRYYVVSSSYRGWYGTATQEGDLVRVKLTFWNGRGNDEITFDLTTMGPRDRGMGHWDETVETWSTFGITFWGNTELRRIGTCQVPSNGVNTSNEFSTADNFRRQMGGLFAIAEEEKTPMGGTREDAQETKQSD